MHQNTRTVVTHLGVSDSTERVASHLLTPAVNSLIAQNLRAGILSEIEISRQLGLVLYSGGMKFHPAIFGVMFCVFGIGALLTAAFKTQPWYVRYVQVAIGLTLIALGILIPLSLHRLGNGW